MLINNNALKRILKKPFNSDKIGKLHNQVIRSLNRWRRGGSLHIKIKCKAIFQNVILILFFSQTEKYEQIKVHLRILIQD